MGRLLRVVCLLAACWSCGCHRSRDHAAPQAKSHEPAHPAPEAGAPPSSTSEHCDDAEEHWARDLTLMHMAKESEGWFRSACANARSELPGCVDREVLWYAVLRCAEVDPLMFPLTAGPLRLENLADAAKLASARKPQSVRMRTVFARATNSEPIAREALALAPRYAPARLALASALIAAGRAAEALESLDPATLRAVPGANTVRARALLAKGDTRNAIRSARLDIHAVWPDPIEPFGSVLTIRRDANEIVGIALRTAGRRSEARPYLSTAAALGSPHARELLD